MKTTTHENLEIENFENWYNTIHKQHPKILGAEWDKKRKTLKIFYEDNATELTTEELKNIQIPTLLRFRKKFPQIDIPNTTTINENEFLVETFDITDIRKKVKEKYPEFEEVSE